MAKINNTKEYLFLFIILVGFITEPIVGQNTSATHTRGKLWETLYNWGFIGDPGTWDYNELTGVGFFPGFFGFDFPNDEIVANGYITDANFHNFRSGPWIIAKNAFTLIPPAFTPELKEALIYHTSLATGEEGVVFGDIPPFIRIENYVGTENFNPLLPEETNYTEFETSVGVKVKQRSMAWSYPGYNDFIIYDYTLVNTGNIAIPSVNQIVHFEQTLDEVWFVFHSGLQVSTKGMLNFHYNSDFLSSAAPAGGFGWHPGSGYSDFYTVENDEIDGKGLLYYSIDYNGGREPVTWDQYGLKNNWQDLLRVRPEWLPELQDPAAFGFVMLYRTPIDAGNQDPFEADPDFFNIYSDELEKFQGKNVDFEGFGLNAFEPIQILEYATHDHRPPNSGNLYCYYTSTFGPYTLAPGDSIRIILAEIAGSLDLHQVVQGDPDHWFPDSTIADIRKNAEAVRNAVKWGFGANVSGVNLSADVPDSPPAPNCNAVNTSSGGDTAKISIRWDKLAEEVQFVDGSGSIFYDGSVDLDGYRVFRGIDKRGIWDLLADIPFSQFNDYWIEDIGQYEFVDYDIQFGFEYYYYVQAYNSSPGPWTSANGTLVNNLAELVSADYNHTELTGAKPGPVDIEAQGWDVFVAPNPFIEGDPEHSFGRDNYKIEFRNLPESATVKIFSLSGDLVRTLNHEPDALGNLAGSIAWDQRSDSGLLVAPGLYIYVVQSETEGTVGSRSRGKLMIIR